MPLIKGYNLGVGPRKALLLILNPVPEPCRALRWLPQASLIKHAFEALCINEFKGLEFELDDNGGGMRTGTTHLQDI